MSSRCRTPRVEQRSSSVSSATSLRIQRHCIFQQRSSNLEDGDKPRRRFNLLLPFQNLFRSMARFRTKFQTWPQKMKRLFLFQMCLIFALAGYTGHKIRTDVLAPPPPVEVSYSSFLDLIERQGTNNAPVMEHVRIGDGRIYYRLQRTPINDDDTTKEQRMALELPSLSPKGVQQLMKRQAKQSHLSAYTRQLTAPPSLVEKLREQNISFSAARSPGISPLGLAIRTFFLAFYGLFLFRLYQNISGGRKTESPGKLARAAALPEASFDDIEGIDSAKYEVMELVDALRNPKSYAMFGARAPTGLLLVGPPGTGYVSKFVLFSDLHNMWSRKTMLARATAATAGVPLIYCSGSDFVEMFVGRGAARVRNIFQQAKKLAPCIIFIDELDALGKSRDSGSMFARSNDEADQTLNQLLACMDGLDNSRKVCVLAATNRKEVLDQALVRPGRFDRIVQLELPNAKGRERILRVHCAKLPNFVEGSGVDAKRINSLGKQRSVDLSAVAAVTEGLSGAELEFIVNEAAIRAVRRFDAAINSGEGNVKPAVMATDFEESVKDFFASRKPRGGLDDMFRGVLRKP